MALAAHEVESMMDMIRSIENLKGPQYALCVSAIFHSYQLYMVREDNYEQEGQLLFHAISADIERLLPEGTNKDEFFKDCKAIIKRIAAANGVNIQ